MASKWCADCEQIVTSSGVPSYCCWCGKDLRTESVLPEFNTWEERLKIIEEKQTKKPALTAPIQLNLF